MCCAVPGVTGILGGGRAEPSPRPPRGPPRVGVRPWGGPRGEGRPPRCVPGRARRVEQLSRKWELLVPSPPSPFQGTDSSPGDRAARAKGLAAAEISALPCAGSLGTI